MCGAYSQINKLRCEKVEWCEKVKVTEAKHRRKAKSEGKSVTVTTHRGQNLCDRHLVELEAAWWRA